MEGVLNVQDGKTTTELKTNDLKTTKVHVRRAIIITVAISLLNPCVLNSATPIHPLGHRLGSVPVVIPVVRALSVTVWRGKNICIGNVGVTLLVTLITPAPM